MPKILRIINRLNLGGPAFNAAYLTKYLEPEFETMLLSGMIDHTEAHGDFITSQLGVQPVYIPEMHREISLWNDQKAYRQIKKIIETFKPDIVHTHAAKAGALGRMAAAASKVPVVIHTFHGHVFHSYFPPWKTRLFLEIEKYLAQQSTRIIAISSQQKEELAHTYKVCPPQKVEVIPLGFDLEKFSTDQPEKRKRFRQRYLVEDDEIVIAIVGRLVPVKNHELFLHAISDIQHKTGRKLRAFIVGDGEHRVHIESKARALQLGFTDFTKQPQKSLVTFTSWITAIDEVYAGADVIALTSLNEGTPVSLIEAQAAGKAIVTTDVGGISNIVVPGQTALLSAAADQELFSANLLQLVESDLFRMKMSSYDVKAIQARFHYSRLADETASLYYRLLDSTT